MIQDQVSERVNGWLVRQINLPNKHGLHLRPAQRIVETATRYESEVRAIKDHLDKNAKSILDMIEFAAYMVNKEAHDDNEFHFHAQGADAIHALNALDVVVCRNSADVE